MKHGEKTGYRKNSPEYNAWKNMRRRCYDAKRSDFARYGGRGIRVCERWMEFANFLADMGRRPGPSYSIERVNNDGHYEPGNCRWATKTEQARNRRSTRLVSWNGRQVSLAQACEEAGIDHDVVRARIHSCGWSVERALTEPAKKQLTRLTQAEADAIAVDSRAMREIAAAFGVSLTTVWKVKHEQPVRTL